MKSFKSNAWMLKKIHADAPQYPEREEWMPMNFIR